MDFEWDEAKNARNFEKHHIDFEFASLIFTGAILERPDRRKEYGESRVIAIGAVDGIEIVVVYTDRGERRRLISARRAHDSERKAYQQALVARSSTE